MKKKTENWLKSTYNLDVFNDVIFKDKRLLKFLFDMSESLITIHLLSGDPTFLGFENKTTFSFSTVKKHIETNNALAEVRGRKTFIDDFVSYLKAIETSEVLNLPFKTKRQAYWLQITFQVITKKRETPALIYGTTNRIYDHVPKFITYYKSTHQDFLTKLFTRETLKKHLSNPEHVDRAYGLYVDLDGFKEINDTFGHQEGDAFLKKMAKVFIGEWEYNVIYYRLGGDEFFVYIYDLDEKDALRKAREIIRKIEGVGKAMGFDISASIGMVRIRENVDAHVILNRSDFAMYTSKARGPGNITLLKKNECVISDFPDQFKTISPRETEKPIKSNSSL